MTNQPLPTTAELIGRLLAFDPLPVVQIRFEFDRDDVVTTLPHDAQWQLWWARVIGPPACTTLSYLHHIASNHGELSNPWATIQAMISPVDRPEPYEPDDLLAPLLRHRLMFVSDAGAGLVYPVPRPGRQAFETVNRQLRRATFSVVGQ